MARAASSYSRLSSNITGGRWTYDVFLSFRGEDTRKNFVDHLYTALEIRGIYTFKDDQRLPTGEPISEQLPAAIEESRFAVVVFSENYADSAWCLDELVHIRDCRKEIGQTVIPVFYNVDPYVVRRQKESFETAFIKHETRYKNEKIQNWKDALFDVAGLSGFDVSNTANGHESECITKIVQEISCKCGPILNGVRNLVGINSRVQDLKSLVGTELDVVRFVGLWGLGGAGKTTLAWAVYNEISYQFEGKSFVENVKEFSREYSGLQILQQKILSELLFDKNLKVNSIHEGIGLMGSRLRRRKVLLVLDDVDDDVQLDALAASHEWFGRGSRIIITTRDQRWLTRPTSIEKYNASLLSDAEAIKLFSLYAFGKDIPPDEYKDDSYYLVRQTGGFPLALKVLGASLYGTTMDEWKSALSRLEVEGEDEVSKMLKVSYGGLSEIDQKIFLDIACFFKGEKKDRIIRILDSFEFHAHFGIKRLIQRSLIYVLNSRIYMHDRIQEMGWHIVCKNSSQPGERSRLWLPYDVCHVLTKKTGTYAVEGISLSVLSTEDAFKFDIMSFKSMNNLRLLILGNEAVTVTNQHLHEKSQSLIELERLSNLRWLTWKGFNLDSLPEVLGTTKLVGLELPRSQLVQLWGEGEALYGRKCLDKLRFINLNNSSRLQRTPDINLTPNLHTLILEWCWNLVEVHPSLGDHEHLVFLSLKCCSKLQSLPSSIGMKSLETLILSECTLLRNFPDIKGNMKRLSKLHLDKTSIEELPASFGNLSGLILLDINYCSSLTSLPSTICELKYLKALYATGCHKLKKLPENLGQIQSLEDLWLGGTEIEEAPSSIALLKNLKTFSLGGCRALVRSMLSTFSPNSCKFHSQQPLLLSFHSLRTLFLDQCNLSEGDIPADLSPLSSLEELNLRSNELKYLPESFCQLPRLKILDVSSCSSLNAFEALPSGIAILKADSTARLTSFPDLSTKYDSLWKISYAYYLSFGEQPITCILKSLLQGQLVANHRLSILVAGRDIPEWFSEQSLEDHPYMQLPLNWYKEDILGFAICTVFHGDYYGGCIDIQFDLIEESNPQYVPQTPINKNSYCCRYHSVWLGFISFKFFQDLFPEFQLDNWYTYTGTIGVSFSKEHYIKCKQLAIRPVYKEDVQRVPTTRIYELVQNDPIGQPWLHHYLDDEEMDNVYSKVDSHDRGSHPSSSTTAYLKERGRMHARLVFCV